MKLSELVAFKNELDKLSAMPAQRAADIEINKITHLVESFSLTAPKAESFNQDRDNITQKFIDLENQLNDLKQTIKKEIELVEPPLFAESIDCMNKK